MKKYLFFLLLFAYSLPQFSQEIRGTVYYLNSDKTPAYGVQITAKGSVGDVSNTDGNYVLKFAKNYPVGTTVYPKVGNKLILKGKKTEEIELVNVEKLEAINIPSDPTLAPIRIIVCKKGERKKVASIVYNTIQRDQEKHMIKSTWWFKFNT